MIVIALEDGVVLQKASLLFAGVEPGGLLKKMLTILLKVPTRNIEE